MLIALHSGTKSGDECLAFSAVLGSKSANQKLLLLLHLHLDFEATRTRCCAGLPVPWLNTMAVMDWQVQSQSAEWIETDRCTQSTMMLWKLSACTLRVGSKLTKLFRLQHTNAPCPQGLFSWNMFATSQGFLYLFELSPKKAAEQDHCWFHLGSLPRVDSETIRNCSSAWFSGSTEENNEETMNR